MPPDDQPPDHGQGSFAHLLDGQGEIQIYVKRDDVGEEAYAAFKQDDLGDILGVKGIVFKTKTGKFPCMPRRLRSCASP